MANIKGYNYNKLDCTVINDENLDFIISKDDINEFDINISDFASELDFSNVKDRHVVSNLSWVGSKFSDSILENIGFTGIDNGFINYERDTISNEEFLNIFINSKFDLSTFGDKFFVTEVNGNTYSFTYDIKKESDYIALKGGFYQGFFKIDGDEYQTLPFHIDDEWNFNFTLRVKDYETKSNILNNRHKNNKGIFFYIGTRAENKFWELYKKEPETKEYKYSDLDSYTQDGSVTSKIDVIRHDYLEDVPYNDGKPENYSEYSDPEHCFSCKNYFEDEYFVKDKSKELKPNAWQSYFGDNEYYSTVDKDYILNDKDNVDGSKIETCTHNLLNIDTFTESSTNVENCDSNDYFADGYGNGRLINRECPDNNMPIDDEYLKQDISLDNLKITDSKEHPINEKGFFEIETDNKFIFFNRTENGFDYKTWKDEYKYIMTGKKDGPNINYFPYLHHGENGYTTDNIDKLIDEHSYTYDIIKDIEKNALALKINDDGSISYRYLVCDGEIVEETSKPGLVTKDEWVNIHLKIKKTSPNNQCYNPTNVKGTMKLYIYINGYLKLVSKELPELRLRRLDDNSERQEGVPYNISIGGGTQGLSERVMLDYFDITQYMLPIETNFAGTFIGDIKNFKFIPKKLNKSNIYKLFKNFSNK